MEKRHAVHIFGSDEQPEQKRNQLGDWIVDWSCGDARGGQWLGGNAGHGSNSGNWHCKRGTRRQPAGYSGCKAPFYSSFVALANLCVANAPPKASKQSESTQNVSTQYQQRMQHAALSASTQSNETGKRRQTLSRNKK